MPDDQTTRIVQHGQIGVSALFPADQQASITIEPAVRAFDDPAPRPCAITLYLALVPTAANPRHHPDLPDMFLHTTTDIAQIQTQPRARIRRRLVAPFAAVGRVGADLFPRPTGPWSSCHRGPASPSQSCRARRTPAGHRARGVRTRPHRSTSETADAPRNASTIPWHRARPTACRCAAPAKSHPSPSGPGCAVDGSPTDAVSAMESTEPSVLVLRRSSASHHHAANSSSCPPNRKSCSLDKQNNRCFNLTRQALRAQIKTFIISPHSFAFGDSWIRYPCGCKSSRWSP